MHFDSAIGPYVLVMVGALIVASIETVFDAPTSPYRSEVTRTRTPEHSCAATRSAAFCSAPP